MTSEDQEIMASVILDALTDFYVKGNGEQSFEDTLRSFIESDDCLPHEIVGRLVKTHDPINEVLYFGCLEYVHRTG